MDDHSTWHCARCGAEYEARPIHCRCGARLAGPQREALVQLDLCCEDGEIVAAAELLD
jgi:hypothetical protein